MLGQEEHAGSGGMSKQLNVHRMSHNDQLASQIFLLREGVAFAVM